MKSKLKIPRKLSLKKRKFAGEETYYLRIINLLETLNKNSKLMYDLLQQDIMHLENRLNVLESAGTYQRTTTYIDPRIKVEGEQC